MIPGKLYREIKLKNGRILEKNLSFRASPTNDDRIARVVIECQEYRLRWSSIMRPPSIRRLEEMDFDGIVETVAGCGVEPDGHDEQGYPSWLLALGMI